MLVSKSLIIRLFFYSSIVFLLSACGNQNTKAKIVSLEIKSFTTSESTIDLGQEALLSWEISDSKEVTVSLDQDIGDVSDKTEYEVTPLQTTTYTLTATNGTDSVSKSLTVEVIVPLVSKFEATPASITKGQESKLEWVINDSEPVTLSIDQGIGDVSGKTQRIVTPVKTTTYTLTATDAKGTVVKETVVVEVVADFDSNLPIVVIKTQQEIPNTSKIEATMSVYSTVYSGNDRNLLTDSRETYDIGIKIRGRTSQAFPKKQYSIETRDDEGDSLNVPLLNLPKENDWVLYAPYSDKSLMRNVLAYNLARRMDRYASRIEFVEVFINGNYKGIYVFMEKIKRDSERVDVSKQKDEDLTGGYLLELAWKTEVPTNGDPYISLEGEAHPILYEYPKADEISPKAEEYISKYIADFHKALYSPSFRNPETGYRKYIDVGAAVDYMIVQELFKNVDAYLASTFMHKDIGKKLTFGPVWDFNISSGNDNTSADRQVPTGFMLHNGMGREHIWAARLLQDPYFVNIYIERWKELKSKGVFENVLSDIKKYESYLDESQKRNFKTWPILDKLVFFNPISYVFNSYGAVVDDLENWFDERISWIDSNIEKNLLIR